MLYIQWHEGVTEVVQYCIVTRGYHASSCFITHTRRGVKVLLYNIVSKS